ncbi:hypothetical protein LOTGIDRAFT_220799 [Lottia gigantea]|uniref:Snake toxin/toxin-like domain-containing protein n=1 Tax=Lottia gigantea TaxID=225164 RepID=V3Z678_LOTGI|nr:hypothetical protein LOTGIDRAFT_220799 [Lottia gigantea]ESO86288.1 hypothetical protein LOTGIDRAFT_220799 [Lottia gigantea]
MTNLIILTCFLGFIATGYALECYVCENQPDNRDKCVKTTIQCREEEDTCLTRITWRGPPFWTPRSEKMHHVAKSCVGNEFCSGQQKVLGLRSMRDWYKDWEAVECCQGDRCNYYVTLGSSNMKYSITVLALSVMVTLFFLSKLQNQ